MSLPLKKQLECLAVNMNTNQTFAINKSIKTNFNFECILLSNQPYQSMKINHLRFHYDKKKIIRISIIMKLIFCLLLIGMIQLQAISNPLTSRSGLSANGSASDVQQGIKVNGVITDAATKDGLFGVTIAVEGTTIGTLTDADGNFSLIVPSSSSVLIFSYIGYTTVKVPLGNQTSINLTLSQSIMAIDEVVVVGYGTQKKATVTGAIISIGKTELMQSPQANISNALVGRMTGLLSIQPQGQPGNDASIIRIRGVGTFTGSQDPLIMVDGIETANYNNIDPNEIESISILKDASATAVYGVRGANGVLIITTKRGKIGKPQVSLSSQYATSSFTEMRHSMNSADYATSFNSAKAYDGFITGGYTPQFSADAIAKYRSHEDPIFYPDVDWFPYMFDKNTGQEQYNLNITGGTEKVKYFVSLGYFNQEGLINHTDLVKDFDAQLRYKRYNIRSNFDFNITKRLSASINLSSQIELRSGTAASDINRFFSTVWETNPTNNPLITDGKFIILDGALSTQSPLIALFQAGYNKNYRNYLNSSVRFNYVLDFISQGLSSHATASYNNGNAQNIIYSKNFVQYKAKRLADQSIVFIPQSDPSPFGFSETFGKSRKIYLEAGLDYARRFGDHNFTGLLLYNQSKFFDPILAYLVPNGYQGIVGRATYDYKGRYLAEINIGYNGTENFAPGKRFGYFPAYSVGWVASDEPFFPKNPVLTYLKLRGSYGVVGNDKIGGNRFLYRPAAYNYATNAYQLGEDGSNQQGYQASLEGPLGNPDLTWERAKKMNIGGEAILFKDKIKVSFDYFDENRDNILSTKNTIPTIVAATMPAYNLGRMSNSGYETEVSFFNNAGKFNYWIKGNFTYAHNVIEFMDEVTPSFPYEKRTGQRFGQFYGLVSEGLFNSWEEVNDANRPVYSYNNNKIQPGDIKYTDINSDGIINADDAVPIGYSNFPEKIFGISFGGDINGFDFSILFQGDANVSLAYSNTYIMPFVNGGSNAPDYMVESWSQERLDNGLKISFPHLNTGALANPADFQPSSFWTKDASYVRIKNAEIGYSLPEKLLKKVGLTYARVYLNGSNLFTWDNMLPGSDPESTSQGKVNYEAYPITRTINMGFNLKF